MLWWAGPASVWQAARGARVSWIGTALLLVAADRSLMAYRWINRFLKNYEDATERLYSRFKDNKSVGADVEAVLDGAAEIDRFMTRRLASEKAERDWNAVRQDLRRLAEAYNVSWRWWT